MSTVGFGIFIFLAFRWCLYLVNNWVDMSVNQIVIFEDARLITIFFHLNVLKQG